MTEEQILKKNKIIDLFVGRLKSEKPQLMPDYYYIKRCKYHSEWSWIMPVVEEIEKLGHRVEIIGLTCAICGCGEENIYIDEPAMTKVETVGNAIVEFIHWYIGQTSA